MNRPNHAGKTGCFRAGLTVLSVLASILSLPAGTQFSVLAPLIRGQKGGHRDLFADLLKQGIRARVDGQTVSLSTDPHFDRRLRPN